jgi:tRNA (guanine37-N1)-methyltransferase
MNTLPVRFDVVSLFEPMFDALTTHGITGRALQRGLFEFHAWNPRDFTSDVHRTVDDRPYGGGPGMVMLAEPLLACVAAIRRAVPKTRLLMLTPHGRRFDQALLKELSTEAALTFICGRYEAIDQRVTDLLQPLEVSVGDFVVSGGELPAMLIMDSIIRRLPGAVNTAGSVEEDSFETGLLDCPHYSRPEFLKIAETEQLDLAASLAVPSVLLSGHHANIVRWRRERMLEETLRRRPALIDALYSANSGVLTQEDRKFLKKLGYNNGLSSSESR